LSKNSAHRLVVLGTDTDAGKSTFSLLWLAHFGSVWGYWKPLQSGFADSEKIRQAFPEVRIFPCVQHFAEAVAPPLAAKNLGRTIPSASELLKYLPKETAPFLIETFGGPFSPLNETELQLELIKGLGCPSVLLSSSAVGAIGRVVGQLRAMRAEGYSPNAVVLLGPTDTYAETEITKHVGIKVFSLPQPVEWTREEYSTIAREHATTLKSLHEYLFVEKEAAPSLNLVARDRKSVWHPYTSLRDPYDPLEVVSARDEFLHLANGQKVIDAFSSWWTILHGHCHEPLMQTLREMTHTLDHVVFAGATHRYAVDVAERLLKHTRWQGQGRAFFSDNGSTAVEVALKLAYLSWSRRGEKQRTLFIGFENGYHGDTFGTMSISRDPIYFGEMEPMLFKAIQVPLCPNSLAETLKQHAGEVAGIVIEPMIQGAGGMQMHTPETFAQIANVCKDFGVYLIADEVMNAFRTEHLWAHIESQASPDLICLSKTLTGGIMPLAVTLASPEIVQHFDTEDRSKSFFHGHSFTGNPIACALASKNLELAETGDWKKNVQRIAQFWKAHADEFRSHHRVKEVRTKGSIFAIEIESRGGYLANIGPIFRKTSLENGVFLRPLGNVLYAMPPLCMSEESLARVVDAMRICLQRVESIKSGE